MTDSIEINFTRLTEKLDEFRLEGIKNVLTTEIIERYMGGFHTNKLVPVKDSWNAQFGRYLKANSRDLKIHEIAKNEAVVVRGERTTASRWSLFD